MVTSQGPRTRFQAQHCQAKQAHIQAATTRRQGTGAADAFADLTTPESASRHTLVLARGLKTTSETSRSQSHRRKRRRANSGEARLANGWRLEELLLLQSLSSTNGGVHTLPLQAALFERSRRTRFPTARQGEGEHNPRLFFFFFSFFLSGRRRCSRTRPAAITATTTSPLLPARCVLPSSSLVNALSLSRITLRAPGSGQDARTPRIAIPGPHYRPRPFPHGEDQHRARRRVHAGEWARKQAKR